MPVSVPVFGSVGARLEGRVEMRLGVGVRAEVGVAWFDVGDVVEESTAAGVSGGTN